MITQKKSILVITAAAISVCLAGCASSAGGTSGAPSPIASHHSTTKQEAGLHDKFDGIPKNCISADDVSLALGVSITEGDPFPVAPTFICSYHGATNSDPIMQVGFNALPAGVTPAQYKTQEQASLPTAQFVSGVGDGAFYYSSSSVPSEMKFISNGISCVIVTFNFTADKAHMVKLADSIIEG